MTGHEGFSTLFFPYVNNRPRTGSTCLREQTQRPRAYAQARPLSSGPDLQSSDARIERSRGQDSLGGLLGVRSDNSKVSVHVEVDLRPESGLPRECRQSHRIAKRRMFDSGAAEGTRTLDSQLGKLALYQLSYGRVFGWYGNDLDTFGQACWPRSAAQPPSAHPTNRIILSTSK